MSRTRNGLIAALDVGTRKTCCLIARVDAGGRPRVVGHAHQKSAGLRNGVIVDMDATAAAISNVIEEAEERARDRIETVLANLSGARPISRKIRAEVPIQGRAVGTAEINRAIGQGRAHAPVGDREIIHCIPLGYALDGTRGIRDPRGMYGNRLGLDLHTITADSGPIRNLRTCIERAHAEVEAVIVSPYAAGLATLTEDEIDLGVTVVDMGAGTTSIAIFYEGEVVFADSIPVGGAHVTNDIALGLTTPLGEAERLKTLHGTCIQTSGDARDLIDVPLLGDHGPSNTNQVPRSMLHDIIRSRLEETFEMVRSHVSDSDFERVAGRSVVLTGGAARINGAEQLANLILDKKVRLGRPLGVSGLPPDWNEPDFAVAAGLLRHAANRSPEVRIEVLMAEERSAASMFGRLGNWIRTLA